MPHGTYDLETTYDNMTSKFVVVVPLGIFLPWWIVWGALIYVMHYLKRTRKRK